LGVFGVVLFAFVGHSVIPSVAGRLERKERILAIAILGVAVPFLLYVVWSLVVIGIVPAASQGGHSLAAAKAQGQPATIPLGFIVGGSVIVLGNVFAVVSTMTSYIGFGLSLKDEYANASDTLGRSIPSWISSLAVVLPPLAVALHSPEGFIRMLDAAGAYGGGLFVGVLPALMVIRLNRKRCGALFVSRKIRLLPYAVLLVYLTGIFYTAWQQFH
jgi:amino acid permease